MTEVLIMARPSCQPRSLQRHAQEASLHKGARDFCSFIYSYSCLTWTTTANDQAVRSLLRVAGLATLVGLPHGDGRTTRSVVTYLHHRRVGGQQGSAVGRTPQRERPALPTAMFFSVTNLTDGCTAGRRNLRRSSEEGIRELHMRCPYP